MNNVIELIKEENLKKRRNVADKVTLNSCMQYHELGFDCIWNDGKDLTLEDKEKEPISRQTK